MMMVSQPNPSGHVVVMRLGEGSRVVLHFHDEDMTQDITSWVCDLLLLGLQASHERSETAQVATREESEVGSVRLEGDLEQFLMVYAHPESASAVEVSWARAAELVALGAAAQITAGVAEEVAQDELPGDPSSIS